MWCGNHSSTKKMAGACHGSPLLVRSSRGCLCRKNPATLAPGGGLAGVRSGGPNPKVGGKDVWADVGKRFAAGSQPDLSALGLANQTIPLCLWSASVTWRGDQRRINKPAKPCGRYDRVGGAATKSWCVILLQRGSALWRGF